MAVAAGQASAATITFTETDLASGSLGGTPFTNALVTLTAIADTNDIKAVPGFPGVLAVSDSSATINVAGLGTATFTGPTMNFANPNPPNRENPFQPNAGLAAGTISKPAADIMDVNNSAFAPAPF